MTSSCSCFLSSSITFAPLVPCQQEPPVEDFVNLVSLRTQNSYTYLTDSYIGSSNCHSTTEDLFFMLWNIRNNHTKCWPLIWAWKDKTVKETDVCLFKKISCFCLCTVCYIIKNFIILDVQSCTRENVKKGKCRKQANKLTTLEFFNCKVSRIRGVKQWRPQARWWSNLNYFRLPVTCRCQGTPKSWTSLKKSNHSSSGSYPKLP